MNRIFPYCALLFFVVAVPVDAAVFQRDWKTPGDGLLTYDGGTKGTQLFFLAR